MLEVIIRMIWIHSVSGVGSVNVGTTINLVSKPLSDDQTDAPPITPTPTPPEVRLKRKEIGESLA